MVAEVLNGAENEKILRWRFQNLSVYGLLRVFPIKRLIAMLHRVMESGLARQRDADGMKFRPVVELTASGVAVMRGSSGVPGTLADLSGVYKQIADDYVLHDLTARNDQNKKENAETNKAFWKGFSDIRIDAKSIWAAGNYVSMTGALQGTNDGDFVPLKAKATGKKLSLLFVDILRFDNGKVKEEWLFSDGASFVTQLLTK